MKNNIKKVILTSLIFILIISFFNLAEISFAERKTKVNVLVRGDLLNIKEGLVLKEDKIYIPIRYLAEALDFKVEWMEKERTVKISKLETEILMPVGKKEIYVNNEKLNLDEKTFIEKERTYIPLRLISEILSEKVEWDEKNRIAIIGGFTAEDEILDSNANYKKISEYMKKESIAAFSPYYEILDFKISNYEEKEIDGNIEATFYYTIIDKNYDKDPDTVAYIKELKESGHRDYQQLYDEYLQAKESNFDLKIIIDKDDKIILYSNASPKGVQWEETEMKNYIMQ